MLIWQHMDQMKRCEYYLDACCWILNEADLNIEIIFSAAESRSHILNIQNSVENLNLYYYILTFILFIYLYFFTLQLKTRNLILSSYPSCHRPRDRVQFSNLSQTPLSVMLGDINCVSQIFFFIWCSSKHCIFHSSILNWEHYTELQEIKHVT